MFATPAVDDRVEDTDSTLVPEPRVNRTHVMNGSIALVSAIVAFVIVRSWFAPAAATAVAPAILIVESQPAGAMLFIDDQPRGATPSTFSIAPGAHTLLVRSGRAERVVQLTLAAGAQAAQYFDLTSSPAPIVSPGRLSVVTDPPGARVTIDGRARGVAPLTLEGITAGAHNITVASDTGSAQRHITVVDGVASEVVFTLPRVPPSTEGTTGIAAPAEVAPPSVPLNINARPWADVLIDGKPVGQTPLANIEVAAGPHEITFRHPELGERVQSVVVTADGPNRVSVDFTR